MIFMQIKDAISAKFFCKGKSDFLTILKQHALPSKKLLNYKADVIAILKRRLNLYKIAMKFVKLEIHFNFIAIALGVLNML